MTTALAIFALLVFLVVAILAAYAFYQRGYFQGFRDARITHTQGQHCGHCGEWNEGMDPPEMFPGYWQDGGTRH